MVTVLSAIASFAGVAAVLGVGLQRYLAAALVSAAIFVLVLLGSRSWITRKEVAENRAEQRGGEPWASGLACDQGPYEVEAGEMQVIELDVQRGERIQGRLREVDGQDFNCYIVDEENLVGARNDEEFNYIRSGESVAADRIRWKVNKDGPLYLLLDLYGKQCDRMIRVSLRRY